MRPNPASPPATPRTIPAIVPPLSLELDELSPGTVGFGVARTPVLELVEVDKALDVLLIVVDAQ